MQIAFNPYSERFISGSLDGAVKEWKLTSDTANLTIKAGEKGVNAVCYMKMGGEQFLVTGGDDGLVKVWNYENGTLLKTLEGHTDNITDVLFMKTHKIVLSSSEDGTVKVWNVKDWSLLETLDYEMGKAWNICKRNGKVAIAYDQGACIVNLK